MEAFKFCRQSRKISIQLNQRGSALWSLLRCESVMTIMRNSGALLPRSNHSPEIINNKEKVGM